MEDGISSNDTEKVTDNKDGTEQLNGVQIQPFNKLTDTVGGRNLLLGTSSTGVVNSNWDNKITVNASDYIGEYLTYSCILDITNASRGTVSISAYAIDSSGNLIGAIMYGKPAIHFGNKGKPSISIQVPSGTSSLILEEGTNNTDINPTVSCRMLETGTIPTDWTPAPEDKADDSKVVHLSGANNFDTVPTVNNTNLVTSTDLSTGLATKFDKEQDALGGRNLYIDSTSVSGYITTTGVLISASALSLERASDYIAIDATKIYQIQFWVELNANSGWYSIGFFDANKAILGRPAYGTGLETDVDYQHFAVSKTPVDGITTWIIPDNTKYVRISYSSYGNGKVMFEQATVPQQWEPAPEDVTNTMATKADDSKVAHLSGANNFDTVPTYGNNEIPLALNNSGSTANRPTGQVVGYQYFDTTLNKPIWYNGTNWVDSTGTTV